MGSNIDSHGIISNGIIKISAVVFSIHDAARVHILPQSSVSALILIKCSIGKSCVCCFYVSHRRIFWKEHSFLHKIRNGKFEMDIFSSRIDQLESHWQFYQIQIE